VKNKSFLLFTFSLTLLGSIWLPPVDGVDTTDYFRSWHRDCQSWY